MSRYQRFIRQLPEAGRFTAMPARMIDTAYLIQPNGFVGRMWRFLKIRAIYAFLFLPLAVVDLVVSGLVGIRFAFGSFFTADQLQTKRLEQQKKYATIFSKNFFALLAFVVGFINPKLIAFYFTPEKNNENGVSAGGSYYRDPNAVREQPETVEELQLIIQRAANAGDKIMPIGAGLSQGKQFLPEGGHKTIVIDLSKFDSIQIDADKKIAMVGAGVRWVDLQMAANKHKLALKVMQASNVFSVGGSIGTNIHGWDHISGVLSNTILSMDIINAQGARQTITPEDDLFHHITGGLGLFGIVVSVNIRLTDNELLTEQGTEVTPAEYVDYFRQTVQTSSETKMHLYRLSLDPGHLLESGVAVSYVKNTNEPPRVTPNLAAEDKRGTRFNQVTINVARRSGWVRKKYWEGERSRLLANTSAPLSTNEIMQPPINAMFNPSVSEAEWLQEYFLPEDQLASFLAELGQLLMANQVILLNASVRFVKQHDQSPLSYGHQGDRFAVVLCFNQSLQPSAVVNAKKWLRLAQQMAIKHNGSYYLPYQHVSSPEDFNAAYPQAAVAQAFKEQVDPKQLFTSGFHQKYLAPQPAIAHHFKTIMANPESRRQFSGFLKNVLKRLDSGKFYALLDDIMQYNDSHAEIYQELCRRLPEIMSSTLGDLRHILQSLSAIKDDLATQAHLVLPEDTKTINGLVEIGYPGRFVGGFKKHYNLTGKVVAVYEKPSLADYIQTGFPRPYQQFETLDYTKPNLTNLEDNSADVVTCYVGLHHFPDSEMNAFLSDIRRVLRPGGHFLLVDHDIDNDLSLSMAHMAHTIFNAVTGIPLEEEMNERRNFQPMAHWQALLAKHELGYAIEGPDVPMIRSGDPSRNRMVSFVNTKPPLLQHTAEPSQTQSVDLDEKEVLVPKVSRTKALGAWRDNPVSPVPVGESRVAFLAKKQVDSVVPVKPLEVESKRSPRG